MLDVEGVVLVAVAVRIMLDPSVNTYYTTGLVFGALIILTGIGIYVATGKLRIRHRSQVAMRASEAD